MNKQNLLTELKIKNNKFNSINSNINEYIFNNLNSIDKELKYSILNKILTNNEINKIIIDYLLNNLLQIEIINEYQFLNKLFFYINIFHSKITIDEWIVNKNKNEFICKGTYDLSYKHNEEFIIIMNKIYDILNSNLINYNITFKMYERIHGNLLIVYFIINKKIN